MRSGPAGTTVGGAPDRIGILGGTGDLGRGLAVRAARAGIHVLLGSRDPDKAVRTVADLATAVAGAPGHLEGVANAEAATAPLVVVSLPAAGAVVGVADLASTLAGRVVLSAVVPLGFDKHGPHLAEVPAEGSVAEALVAAAPEARVVAGLHAVSAVSLGDPDADLPDDVPLCSDDAEALATAAGLIAAVGLRPIAAGPLRLARSLEALTPLLIAVNRRHGSHAGIALTGL